MTSEASNSATVPSAGSENVAQTEPAAEKTTMSPSSSSPTAETSSSLDNDAAGTTTSVSTLTTTTTTMTSNSSTNEATTETQAGEPTSSTPSAASHAPDTSFVTNAPAVSSVATSTLNAATSIATAATNQLQQLQERVVSTVRGPVDPNAPKALAFTNSTPWAVRYLIPILCIVTHIVFYYGQTIDMWKLRLSAHVDVWANATDIKSRTAFNAFGFDRESHYVYDEEEDVETFTYWYAIRQLWIAKGMPGKTMPRFAAVLLVLFSGVWPHLKLFLLQMTWWTGHTGLRRTRMLRWLSTLGKWSLADVLTVCVMVGVLHLDWEVDPAAIKTGLVDQLPTILEILKSQYDSSQACDIILKMTCADQKNIAKKTKCNACWQFVHEVYMNPNWAQSTGQSLLKKVKTSGGGDMFLRVEGMSGIYAFCAAVILSILISVVVDFLDHRANQQEQQDHLRQQAFHSSSQQQQQQQQRRRRQRSRDNTQIADGGSAELEEPLLVNHMEMDFGQFDQNEDDFSLLQQERRSRSCQFANGVQSCKYLVLAVATLGMMFFAVDLMTMERVVHGAAPQLLHDILGVAWERTYSLHTLTSTTGAAGGWDYLLMGTFALFCVVGPIVRAFLCLSLSLMDKIYCCGGNGDESNNQFRRAAIIRPIATTINFIGAFCAWEVFVIAILMVDMLMPSITNTIIMNPACAKVSDDGSCLQVEFNVMPYEFATIVIGGFLLIATASTAINESTKELSQAQDGSYQRRESGRLMRRTNGPNNSIFYQLVGGGRTNATPSRRLRDMMRRGDYDMERLESALEELVFETEQV